MGQRSRKRGRREPPGAPPVSPPAPSGPGRSERRNAAVREGLIPISPGERPWALSLSAAICVTLAVVNLGLFLAGTKPHVGSQKPQLPEILVFSGLMLACAVGMWRLRYWAVLGYMTLLAIGLLGFCLALIRVSNVLWGLVCVVVIGAGGYLFVKLVRVLSRLQLPLPPGR